MRDRLIAVSEEVSQALGSANWYVENAPLHLRAQAQAAVGDILQTQEWLKGRIAYLPANPQQRYEAMRDMLEVQFVALQKITSLVEHLIAVRLPAQPAALAPVQPAPAPAQLALPPPSSMFGAPPAQPNGPLAVDFAPAIAQGAVAPLFPPPAQAVPRQPVPQHPFPPVPQVVHQAPQVLQAHDPRAAQHAWPNQPIAEPVQGGYGAPLRLSDLDVSTARPAADLPRAVTGRRPAPKKPQAREGLATGKAVAALASRRGLITGALVTAIVVVGLAGYLALTHRAGNPKRVAIGDPSARNLSKGPSGPAPVRNLDNVASRVPAAPPMSAPPLSDQPSERDAAASASLPGGGFVPVIATHRDKQALSEMYAQLRRQYPSIVAAREAKAQTLNLGAQGVWHQLILMPPVPRPQAQATCDALRDAGYTRCGVRTYRRP